MSEKSFVFVVAGIPGVFAFDKDKEMVASSVFPRDSSKILDRLDSIRDGEQIEELREVVQSLDTKNIVTDIHMEIEGYNVEIKDSVSASEYLEENMRKLSLESGFVEEDSQFNRILRDIQIIKTRKNVKSSVKKDKVVSQAVSALQDLRRISNELSERLREWYGLYYPELKVKGNEKYTELVAGLERREEFEEFKGSMGIDLDKRDIDAVKGFAERLDGIYKEREELKKYLEDVMKDVAPNINHIIGSEMGAQLISLAGSLKKLARMPSSKIQLLGAEKALFRHLKGGGKPPKYGIIYNHPYIQQTPEGKRGKAARKIASTLMMAARTDQYTGKFKGKKYKKKLQRDLEEIRNE